VNIPKNSRVDANAMERRAKYQTISGRLKSKLDEKRKSAEVESIENGYRRRPAIRTISSLN
jgi:hypothetical protein